MFELFGKKQKSLLGIDISSRSVKVLEILQDGEKKIIKSFGIEPVKEEAFEDGNIINHQLIADAIKRIVAREKISTKKAAFAIPDAAVITRIIQLNEELNEDEMEELVILEADKFIPYSIDEINLDFEVLGVSPKNPAMIDVLMVASRATNVENRMEVARLAGLEASVIDVESFAIERVVGSLANQLPAEGVDKLVAVIDVGAKLTHLFVLDSLKIIFTREEEFGSSQMIQSICRTYDVSAEEAEAMFHDEKPDDFDEKIVEPFKEALLVQIKRTLQFFYSTSSHQHIDFILLAGGVAAAPGIDKEIEKKIDCPTSICNPFADMTLVNEKRQQQLHQISPSLLVSCGLAMRTLS